ncbi:OmpH family outer membrane protein [Schlegelella sp. S2-27]|uniref:OmpH family outer membrane protein n=1 Tax=Caldimonas mangrovi TaxID=2944811 RepID=A0ABT0YT58_9BURK|nr:OmpH family outer membrane protein [Caldimonas mangrovi]MCM5681033.1 OmpH family outer membrane protein [Caldimonas mangrovi]
MKSALCAGLLALTMQGAQAQELKIGYVSSDRVMRDSELAKAAEARLRQEFSRQEKELADMAAKLKTASDKLDKEAPTLAESERGRRQRDLVDMDREFQRKRREYQEDASRRRNEELSAIIDRANGVIKRIAEQEKYDLIIQEAVHWSPRVDITDKVIKALNANGGK